MVVAAGSVIAGVPVSVLALPGLVLLGHIAASGPVRGAWHVRLISANDHGPFLASLLSCAQR
jgi:hypothetical protein